MKDKELIELLQKDPRCGLMQVVDIYSAYVLKIVCTKLGDVCTHEDIEEAVSDIFMAFFTSGQKCNFKLRSIRAYLSVIAERHCVNVFKRMSKQVDDISIDEIENTLADSEATFDSSELCEAIHKLGTVDEFIFVRKYFFGQKNESIAKELGMKTNTVNKRISRGLLKLRKLLEEEK